MDDTAPVAIFAILVLGACAVIALLGTRFDQRNDRCSRVCYPMQVVSCQSGATWCADGKVHWRKEGEP